MNRKSVTLDSWTREQISAMRQIGNKASNAIWNPNEALHPPPTSLGAEERDSEVEKYIRRKYEQGAFKAGAPKRTLPAPTSLNRAREMDGRLPSGSVTSLAGSSGGGSSSFENKRNPELNDILAKKPIFATERDLPALPVNTTGAAPRPRPARSNSSTPAPNAQNNPQNPFPSALTSQPSNGAMYSQMGSNGMLINMEGGISSTMPLQLNVPQYATNNPYNPFGQQQQQPRVINTAPIPSTSMFPISPGPSSSLQIPNSGYGMSSSVPNTGMLASFDPLHPASQQFQQQQTYPPQQQQYQQSSYGNTGYNQSHSPNPPFQQFSPPAGMHTGGYMSPQYTQQQHQYSVQTMNQQQQMGLGMSQSFGSPWAGGIGGGSYMNGMR